MTTTTRYTPLLLFEKERNDAVVVVGSIGVSFAFLSLLLLFMRERDCREECRFELDETVCWKKTKLQNFFFDDFNLGFYGIQNVSSFPFLSFPFLLSFFFFWRLLKRFRFWIILFSIIKDTTFVVALF